MKHLKMTSKQIPAMAAPVDPYQDKKDYIFGCC